MSAHQKGEPKQPTLQDEKISASAALRRGYEWIQCGYDHRLNKPLIGSIQGLKPFLVFPISVAALDESQRNSAGSKQAGSEDKPEAK